MARIFITGSSDGLGSLTAKKLVASGHQVVLHARNAQRARDAAVLVADLTSTEQTRRLAAEADRLGPFDAVLHNAGLYIGMERVVGASGLPALFAVNTLAPYLLTCLMRPPRCLVFVSSGMHRSGRARLDDLPASGYGDSKLHAVMLAKEFARRWPGVESNAVDPGWVPTKMGGRSAPGNLDDSVACFAMLALGEGAAEGQSGKYFYNSKQRSCADDAGDVGLQDGLLKELEKLSGVAVPEST